MTVTVVVHADRPDLRLFQLVARIFTQTERDLDVWLAVTHPPQDLAAIRAHYPVGVLEFAPGTPLGAMLNEAFGRSIGEVVVTLEATWMPRNPDWLTHLTRHFLNSRVAASTGTDYDPERVSAQNPWYAQDLLDYLAAPQYSLSFANAAFKRDAWEQRVFSTSDRACADKLWAYRILQEGHLILIDYESRCHENPDRSNEEAFRRFWAMNLAFDSFLQIQEDGRRLWRRAIAETLRLESLTALVRFWKRWTSIKQRRFWQRNGIQAFLARQQFVKAGGKWAL
jgi:hypothetical protein